MKITQFYDPHVFFALHEPKMKLENNYRGVVSYADLINRGLQKSAGRGLSFLEITVKDLL